MLGRSSIENLLRWGWMTAAESAIVWDIEGLLTLSRRQVQLVRNAGALAQLPLFLSQVGLALPWTGDFAGTAALISEVDNVAAAIGSPIAPYSLLRLRALQGREAEATTTIESALELAAASGQGMAAVWANWAAAVLYNALSRYEETATAAEHAVSDTLNPFMIMWALPELVEAAARKGDTSWARDAMAQLAETTQPCGTDIALGIEARCRALVSGGATAADLYREAIERLSRTGLRPELARSYLLYGEWLRRENQQVESRAAVRTAHEMLTGIGMEGFAERARDELRATGEKVRKWTLETRDDLTAQERQIALLAREGLSTRRSVHGSSSARGPLNGSCATCSASSGSVLAASWPPRSTTRKRRWPKD